MDQTDDLTRRFHGLSLLQSLDLDARTLHGGMTGGGMGGMTGGGMGGGAAGVGGGLPGNGGTPSNSASQSYGGGGTSSGDPQNYQCITPQGHCSVASSPGSLRHGASCTCLLGGPGKIK